MGFAGDSIGCKGAQRSACHTDEWALAGGRATLGPPLQRLPYQETRVPFLYNP